jgi:hypothetical protein
VSPCLRIAGRANGICWLPSVQPGDYRILGFTDILHLSRLSSLRVTTLVTTFPGFKTRALYERPSSVYLSLGRQTDLPRWTRGMLRLGQHAMGVYTAANSSIFADTCMASLGASTTLIALSASEGCIPVVIQPCRHSAAVMSRSTLGCSLPSYGQCRHVECPPHSFQRTSNLRI